jgi:SOS-response transcriptional repressor LexA
MDYYFLEVYRPDRSMEYGGVVLVDVEEDKAYLHLRKDWERFGADDAEVLEGLETLLREEAAKRGGKDFIASLEDLSNQIQLSPPSRTMAVNPENRLRRLFRENVSEQGAIPYVDLKAAAGGLSDEAVAPGGEHDLFIARVVGRSMEPLIPDGSLCLFRRYKGGSRDGKRVLVWRRGLTDETAQFTVKIYRSEKIYHEDGAWEHSRIRMIPLNPDFEEWLLEPDEFRVLGEFVRVVEPEE